jgi:hypothetical protein
MIFDARRAARDTTHAQLQAADVRTHLLTDGGTFDPATGIAVPGRAP